MSLTKNKKVKKEIEIENTYVRKLYKIIRPYLDSMIGHYYKLVHILIMGLSGILLLYNNNIYHLLVLFNFVCLDCVACVFLHDCPLTLLEQKYLGNNIIIEKTNRLKKGHILYKCNHHYEKTLEFLTNMLCFIFGKILFLIIMQMFQFQIKFKHDS